MSGHTPGPWAWDEAVKEPSGLKSRTLDSEPSGDSVLFHSAHWDVKKADRALVAASPDLLVALKECAAMIEDHYRGALGFASKAEKNKACAEHVTLAAARRAIAKAEGR